jgi:hypothetical protein
MQPLDASRQNPNMVNFQPAPSILSSPSRPPEQAGPVVKTAEEMMKGSQK